MNKLIFAIILFVCFSFSIKAINPDSVSVITINPNPFDSITVISFTTFQSDTITLTLLDIVGTTKKAIFYNTVLPAGTYSINFVTDSLASGVYFLKLKYNSLSKVSKLIKSKGAVGLNENKSSQTKINIFPNPTSSDLNINYFGKKHIQLLDVSGKIIYKTTTDLNVINLSNIAMGTYVLKVFNAENKLIVNQKIIKVD